MFFIIVLTCMLLLYKNRIDFCVLNWYPATLLNSFGTNFMDTLGFFYIIIQSANRGSFISSFLIYAHVPGTSFSCLIELARTFSAMLNKFDLFLILEGKYSFFYH